ncbi:MAG: protein arginine kinase [Verrucomicrobia bacterium]|nr:protein arginine kinase [Verrucomicrobiota bacterium]MBV9671835.1 protein arginine kinase [Verrucomicrobiota bacterium]
MKIGPILAKRGDWLSPEGGDHPVVISSRVRLARNLSKMPFPGWAKKTERIRILDEIKPEINCLNQMKDGFSEHLNELSAVEKQVLVERHLISREHAAKGVGSAVMISSSQAISIMINEEDHLRMQAITSGLDLLKTFQMIDEVDTALEAHLDFAFDPELGYLTACPTNVGTGMRASAMVHLPGLVLGEQVNQVVNSVNKIGLAVRGLYGEGTEALGNLFQVSNQTTLGEKESQIIERLNKVIETLIQRESQARENLLATRRTTLLDQIGRAYGILTHAHSVSSKEALNLLSIMRLGIDLGFFPEGGRLIINALLMETQPAHLQHFSQQKLAAEERDYRRADIVREKLKSFPKPNNTKESGDHTADPAPESK